MRGDCGRYEEFGFSLAYGNSSAGETSECTGGDFDAETFDGYIVFLFHSFLCLRFLSLAVQGSDLSGLPFGQLLMWAVAKRKSRSPWQGSGRKGSFVLSAQLQFFKDRGVAIEVEALEVVEQLAAASSHSNEAATRVKVFTVFTEVLSGA